MKRIVWFSCGAASAVTARLIAKQTNCNIVYCMVTDEHKDNLRFLADCEKWIGQNIEIIKSSKYKSVDDVIEKKKYISGIKGAPCTLELKRNVRLEYADVNDVHYWGFTLEEVKRAKDFDKRNTALINHYPLIEYGITKQMCLGIIQEAGIDIPIMYKLGYEHNNCIGCVKSQSPKYWNMIRKDFPEVFKKRCEQSRKLNVRMIKLNGVRMFLDELPETATEHNDIDISCDIGCQAVYNTEIL